MRTPITLPLRDLWRARCIERCTPGSGSGSGETGQPKGWHRAPGRLHRPPLEVIVAFVDENRDQFGVEFICRHLQVAPSTYYAAKKRQTQPCARAVRDAVMMQILLALWIANRKVYGAHKLWKAAHRAGHDIGRDQVARLMREMGIEGVSRLRKKVFTTRQDPDATRAPDLVNRQFKADRPDALWVTDLT